MTDTNIHENKIDSISKQIKELRKIAKEWEYSVPRKPIQDIFNEAEHLKQPECKSVVDGKSQMLLLMINSIQMNIEL